MLKPVLYIFFSIIVFSANAIAETGQVVSPDDASIITVSPTPEIATECASRVFADALAKTAHEIDAGAHETVIQQWIYQTFAHADVLTAVLACPEIAGTPDADTIKFTPIQYTFPTSRQVVINYETQPKILKQRLALASKRELPSDENPNPRIGARDDTSVWTNTDPAWYAIMVVQHDALRDFVGADKNNTVSLEYIRDNIDDLYPHGLTCTSKSALANDNFAINQAVTKTVNVEDDSNDYYIAGDVNLQWISYAEIALDVAITVATMGGGTVILGVTKSVRASRALKNLIGTIKTLSKSDDVARYIRATRAAARLTDEINALDNVADSARIADKTAELKNLNKTISKLEKIDDVAKYRDATKTFSELNALRRGLRGIHNAQRGNIIARIARVAKATKSAMTGNDLIKTAARLGRSSKLSGRIRDWLFHSTLSNAGAVAKMTATGGLIYGALKFAGDMYDWTETSTGEFSSGVDFAPLLLLSADDLQGQENTVNHGMWLLWAGDSVSAADDDAAYLQAMDFAAKFHQDLMEYQDDTSSPCDIDIFVVRPIMRNPGTDNTKLYYLIMNDEPWTTHEQ